MKINLKNFNYPILSSLIILSFLLVLDFAVQKNISVAQEEKEDEIQELDIKRKKEDLIKAGRFYYNSKKYELAIEEWEKALSLDPENKKIKKYIDGAKKRLEKQDKRKKIEPISVVSPPKETIEVLSLDVCIDIAIKNSIPLQVAKKNITLAEMRIWEAKRNLFPKFSAVWEESEGKIQARHYVGKKEYVEGSQTIPLFQGAETYYIMKQAEINLKVTKEEYKKTRNDLVLQVKKSFYALAKAKENLKIQTGLKTEVDRIFDMVNRQHEAGILSKLELLNVSSQASQVKYQLASAEGDESMAELMLKQAMTVDYKDRIEIEEPKLEFKKVDVDFEKALNAAFFNRPEMKINSLTVEYNKYERDIARAKGWPKVELMGNWGLAKEEYVPEDLGTDPDRRLEQQWYAGTKVSMPLWGSTGEFSVTKEQWVPVINAFSGTEATTKTAKFNLLDKLNYFSDKLTAEIGLDRARQELEKVKQDITSEVKESCFGYEKAVILLDTSSNKVRYQEKDLELIRLRRDMDEAQDSNIIESMIKLAQEKFGYVQALVDCYIAVASINKAIGVDNYFKAEETQPK